MADLRHSPPSETIRRIAGLPSEEEELARREALAAALEKHPESNIFGRGTAQGAAGFDRNVAELMDMVAGKAEGILGKRLLRPAAESARDQLRQRARKLTDWADATRPEDATKGDMLLEGLSSVPIGVAGAAPYFMAGGPVAGFGALGFLEGRQHGEKWKGAAKGAALGSVFKYTEPWRRLTRVPAIAAADYALHRDPAGAAVMGVLGGIPGARARMPKPGKGSKPGKPEKPSPEAQHAYDQQTNKLREALSRAAQNADKPNAPPGSVRRAADALDAHMERDPGLPRTPRPTYTEASEVGQMAFDMKAARLQKQVDAAKSDRVRAKREAALEEHQSAGPRMETRNFGDATPAEWQEVKAGMHPDIRADAQAARDGLQGLERRRERGLPDNQTSDSLRKKYTDRLATMENLDRKSRSGEGEQPGSQERPPSSASNTDIPLKVTRIEEPGVSVDHSKPQGLYTTPSTATSPHADLGGKVSTFDVNPNAKVLRLSGGDDLVTTNRGTVGQSAGIDALRTLVGEAEYLRLSGLSKSELLAELSARHSSVKWGKYFDQQEMLEGLAGIEARARGFDALWQPASEAKWSEFVSLTDRALKRDSAATPGPVRGVLTPEGKITKGEDGLPLIPEGMTTTELAERMERMPVPGEVPFITPEVLRQINYAQTKRIAELMVSDSEKHLMQGVHARIANVFEELLEAGKIPLNPHRNITTQAGELLNTRMLTDDVIEGILKKNNMTSDQMEAVFRQNISDAARILGAWGNVSRKFRKWTGRTLSEEEKLAIEWSVNTRGLEQADFWKRLDNIRRGAIVSQLATTMRNAETQMVNVMTHTMADVMHRALLSGMKMRAKMFGNTEAAAKISAEQDVIKPFYTIANMIMRNRQTRGKSEHVLRMFPEEWDKLKSSYSSDVYTKTGGGGQGKVDKVLDVLEKGTKGLNYFNRGQEFFFRDHTFMAAMDRRLTRAGFNIEELEREGLMGTIDREIVKGSVNDALSMTWARDYNRFAVNADGSPKIKEQIAGDIIHAINNNFGFKGPLRASLLIPFPRFFVNALEWQAKFQPFRLIKLGYSPKTWKALANGDPVTTAAISKAVIGAGMFGGAVAFRMSKYAGDKWDEARPDGEPLGPTVDIKPYNPMASYVFVAEMARRSDIYRKVKAGILQEEYEGQYAVPFTTKEIAMGLASIQLRAGAGLYAVDKFLDGLLTESDESVRGFGDLVADLVSGDLEAAIDNDALKATGGALSAGWSGLVVPFQQIKDLSMSMDIFLNGENAESDILRDPRTYPITGMWRRRIPGADSDMPEVVIPTQKDPPRTAAPLTRQLTGLTFRNPKSKIQSELDRLGFNRGQILQTTGVPEWNDLMNRQMSAIFDEEMGPIVDDPEYDKMPDALKARAIRDALRVTGQLATSNAIDEDPDLYEELLERRRPRIDRMAERWERNEERRLQQTGR